MTPMRGGGGVGGGYSGAQPDNGLTPLQQQVLGTISSCPNYNGISISDLVGNMKKHGHGDIKIKYVLINVLTYDEGRLSAWQAPAA